MKKLLHLCIFSLLILSLILPAIGCQPPQATFEASVPSGTALLTVDFTNKTETSLFKKADEFKWDFGDGATMTTTTVEQPVTHDYTSAGEFTVTLTVVKKGEPPETTIMTLTINVTHGPLDQVKLNPDTVELDIGQTQEFVVMVVDAYGNPISEAELTWEAAEGVGTVAEDGILTAGTKAGTYDEGVTVNAKLSNIYTQDSTSVTIKPDPLEIVTISPIVVVAGETQQLDAAATDQYGNLLDDVETTWLIIDENAGSITPEGLLEVSEIAKNYDEAIEVQVKQGDLSRTARAPINVTPGPLGQLFVAPDPSEIGMEMTQQFVAVGADKYGNRISGLDVNWRVVNDGGTIDESGLFTAGGEPDTYKDTVKAEATQGDITLSTTVDVTVEPERIAFLSDRDNEDDVFDIYIMDIEGNNQKRLTTNNANTGRFSCSPNGRRIVYSLEGPEGDIYTINDDGSWEFPLVSGRKAYEPDWSPDGTKIVFQSWEDDTSEIYVMDADGGNFVQLTHNSAYEDYPIWSPDGTEIVFVSDRDGNTEIYAMNADGTDQRRLTRNSTWDTWPSWSPDGKEILFQTLLNNQWTIFIMDVDGTDVREIASSASYSNNWPSWSPDGTQITFHSWKDPNQAEIYIMDLDGNNMTRLTDNSAHDYGPLWLPRKMGVETTEASVIIPETSEFKAMTAQEVTTFAENAVVRIETDLGMGSGFIIDPAGLIITNNHVVKDAEEITVYLKDGTEYSGTVKARDMIHDLALVEIKATGLHYLELGEMSGIGLGQQVIVLGYPLNTEKLTVTSGLVSVVDFDSGRNITWIQTDSAVNPGNSGGPMLDLRGRVIGIVAAKIVGIAVEGVGFAISVSTINVYLTRLKAGETITK